MPTLTELRQEVLRCVSRLRPETMSGDAAAAAVAEFATIEKAAATARMFAALRVAKTDAWKGRGHASAADWLADAAGITVRQAAAQLGTARKAERLPKTKEQMERGKLSPTQAGAVAEGASADPQAEESLLDAAEQGTTADLQAKAAKAKAAATDAATREGRIRAERTLRTRTDAEGAFCLWLRGPAADGARLLALLKPFEEHAFRHGRSAGARDTFENRSYDAFFTLLAWLQSHGGGGAGADPPTSPASPGSRGEPRPTGDPTTDSAAPAGATPPDGTQPDRTPPDRTSRATDPPGTTPSGAEPPGTSAPGSEQPGTSAPGAAKPGSAMARSGGPPRSAAPPASAVPAVPIGSPHPLPDRLPGGNNVKVIVLVDHTALMRGRTVAGETCEIAGVGPISVEAARQILRDDPFLAVVVRRGREVVSVAHHGRGLNAHQRTAIEADGVRCANLACNRTVAIQIDHRRPYAEDPVTALGNQDPLCPECHRRKTHHGWRLEPGTGRRRFLPPEDRGRPNPTGADPAPTSGASAGPAAAGPTPADVAPGDRTRATRRPVTARSTVDAPVLSLF